MVCRRRKESSEAEGAMMLGKTFSSGVLSGVETVKDSDYEIIHGRNELNNY